MKATVPLLSNALITLEPADEENVPTLVRWTLDPVAQGPHKCVPTMNSDELRALFLQDPDRQYFLIRRTTDGEPLGRFYYRAWRFADEGDGIDWEVNVLLADPSQRGKGYGTAAQQLATDYLLERHDTRSVFAYTSRANTAERRALQKVGFEEIGPLPHVYYRVESPSTPHLLYVRLRSPTRIDHAPRAHLR
jgi:aminoglycoside 6'-N-acetyltransferase